MNDSTEGLEYAQMLEIPVSTVNVVKKRGLFSRRKHWEDLKDKTIESVNDRLSLNEADLTDADGFVRAEDLTPTEEVKGVKKKGVSAILIGETVAACLLAVGIFLTNLLVLDTAINTFLSEFTAVTETETPYNEITLTSPVSETSDAEIIVGSDGVLTFQEKTSVYPLCDGEITSVTETDEGYTVKISHTSTFCSVVTGLDTVYSSVGDEVKGNLPFAYSLGEREVSISMYDGEELLNCYTLTGAVPVWNS